MENIIAYEFIGISVEATYELLENRGIFACEDTPDLLKDSRVSTPLVVEYDDDGIPMGNSKEEIEQREIIINDFFENWSSSNPERKVFNERLGEYIYVRAISIIEAKEHSSKSYKSTRAIMIIDEILKNASPIRRVPKKAGNRNQKEFEYMLVMVYKHIEIGTIKLTVGVKQNSRKIQYGLTALRPGQPLINGNDSSNSSENKKRKPHK